MFFAACKGTKVFRYYHPISYHIVEIMFLKALNLDKYLSMSWKMDK